MKTIISVKNEINLKAAAHVRAQLKKKPDSVLALVAGQSVKDLYAELLSMYRAGHLSFSKARVFAVTEYVDVAEHLSCRHFIYDDFLSQTDLPPENFYSPQPERLDEYDKLIERLGGIDLAVLGIGNNAHVGYNEPATPFSSCTHVQKLTDSTKRQLAPGFGGVAMVPEKAVTMGIKTITQARDIMILAFGGEKSQAVHKMLYGRNDSVVPAAFLQIPMNVSVYLDEFSSSEL